MPFEIHPVYPRDIPKLIEIEFAAYANSPSSKILRARDSTKIEHHIRAHFRYNDLLKPHRRSTMFKIIDTDEVDTTANVPAGVIREFGFVSVGPCQEGGKIIGWYRFEVFEEGVFTNVPLDYWFTMYPWTIEPPQHRSVVRNYWEESEHARRFTLIGRPHIHLCLMVIHPDYQRRGAGTRMLQHFCAMIERRGDRLPAYCAASSAGKDLYERFGFSVRTIDAFPTRDLGIPGSRLMSNMVREPGHTRGMDPEQKLLIHELNNMLDREFLRPQERGDFDQSSINELERHIQRRERKNSPSLEHDRIEKTD